MNGRSAPNDLDSSIELAVSDFSGLENLEAGFSEPQAPVSRVSYASVPLPELFPEARAELEAIKSVRTVVEVAKSAVASTVSAPPANETADAPVSPSEPEAPAVPEIPDERQIYLNGLKFSLFEIISEDDEFPPFHAKALLDLAGELRSGTPGSELADVGTLLLYLSETLGAFFNVEEQWNDHKESYMAAARIPAPSKSFRFRPMGLLGSGKTLSPEELEARARTSFERDYARWKTRFAYQLRKNGARPTHKFKADSKGKPFARSVERCLEEAFSVWKSLLLEYRRAMADEAKAHGQSLVKKIEDIEADIKFEETFGNSAKRPAFRQRKRHKEKPQ